MGLEAVVLRCLEKSRRSGFQDVAEVAKALALSDRNGPTMQRATLRSPVGQGAAGIDEGGVATRGRKMLAAALASVAAVVVSARARSCGAILMRESRRRACPAERNRRVPVDPREPFAKSR